MKNNKFVIPLLVSGIYTAHNCTNIAIWHIVNDVIPVRDTGMALLHRYL
ncbi:hypothetical protein [Wolbachia endosymbiont of Rhagoletis cerasi]|nr:hypothetical protein [Wolbachia endosymbiont of Rhagoletis cerasi]MCX3064626.1 hypothetical protein [Wolbachia endosymbiont of Drosophila pseudotakahashii]